MTNIKQIEKSDLCATIDRLTLSLMKNKHWSVPDERLLATFRICPLGLSLLFLLIFILIIFKQNTTENTGMLISVSHATCKGSWLKALLVMLSRSCPRRTLNDKKSYYESEWLTRYLFRGVTLVFHLVYSWKRSVYVESKGTELIKAASVFRMFCQFYAALSLVEIRRSGWTRTLQSSPVDVINSHNALCAISWLVVNELSFRQNGYAKGT